MMEIGIVTNVIICVTIFPSSLIIDRFGCRAAVTTGAILSSVGSSLRIMSSQSIAFVWIGTLLVNAGLPFVANSVTKIASLWFPPNRRTTANAIGSVACPLGGVIGVLMPVAFIKAQVGHEHVDNTVKMVLSMFSWDAGIMIAALVLVLIFFREKPDVPIS